MRAVVISHPCTSVGERGEKPSQEPIAYLQESLIAAGVKRGHRHHDYSEETGRRGDAQAPTPAVSCADAGTTTRVSMTGMSADETR
jgi:hypothetical protein